MEQAKQVLRQYFGYPSFRPNQQEIVEALLAGRDVLAIMPTGAGKSLCFQVPALCLPAYTLVVSPLISLMKDQVEALQQAGVPSTFLNSTLGPASRRKVLEEVESGECKLLYVSAERLASPDFRSFCANHPPALLAIDEAHCISSWGQDFRPEYTQIMDFVAALPKRPPVGAFTATATEEVRRDIEATLKLQNPLRVQASFDRPNLHFEVRHPKNKNRELAKICKQHKGESGIVYCISRRAVEEACSMLVAEGFSALPYHAGLGAAERRLNQDKFVYDEVPIVVATNAFGMGIDKSNVSFIVHYNMPLDLESYYQEAGRAGRDGQPASCILLYAPKDVHTCNFLLTKSIDEAEGLDWDTRALLQERGEERVRQMTFYCTTSDCLRGFILRYFNEPSAGFCGNCSNCETKFEELDATEGARKIISCVYRLGQRGRQMGKSRVVEILHGSKAAWLLDAGLDSLSTYGIMADCSAHRIRFICDALLERGLLASSGGQYPTLMFTQASGEFLRNKERLLLKVPKEEPKQRQKEKEPKAKAPAGAQDTDLFEELRKLRLEIAQEQDVAAFVVFSNASLADMAARKPRNEAEFLQVSGVGKMKCEKYAARFLACIRQYEG